MFTIIPRLQSNKLRLKEKNAFAYTQEAVKPGVNLKEENVEPDPWFKSQILRIICEFIHPFCPKAIECKVFF